jgi:hypothetical protein
MGFVRLAVPRMACVGTAAWTLLSAIAVNPREMPANSPRAASSAGSGVVVASLIGLITLEHSNFGAETDTPCQTVPI